MRVGILGGGQLGRMLALAGLPLGHTFTFLDPSEKACAAQVGKLLVSPFTTGEALRELISRSDVLTAEFENVPATVAEEVLKERPFYPGTKAFYLGQNRLREKEFFQTLKIDTPKFCAVNTRDELLQAAQTLGFPFVLKTTELGYDGKGQWILRSEKEVSTFEVQAPSIAEEFISFDRELSIIGVRTKNGEVRFYPLVQNIHREGILIQSTAPAPNPPTALAEDYLTRMMTALSYVGVCTLELFQSGERLLANEFAPRVHNSGHWTIEGAVCSQFENHIRAVTGMPLGSTELVEHSVMLNILGTVPPLESILSERGVHLHLYGKSESPKRKIGHVTVVRSDAEGAALEVLKHLNS